MKKPLPDRFFVPLVRGAVIDPALQRIRHTLHAGELFRRIMGVLITFPVMEILHQLRGRIAKIEGDGFGGIIPGVLQARLTGLIDGVGAGGHVRCVL